MTPTHTHMTFNGRIVNLQIVLGGNPTINNYAHPPESPGSVRPTPHSSRPGSPSASNLRGAPSVAQGHSSIAASESHRTPAAVTIPFPSPHLEPYPSSASLLSPIGSPVGNLNGLQACTLITPSTRQSNAAEGRAHQFPSAAAYVRSNAGDLRLRGHERVDNNLFHQDDCTANMYRSTQRVSFPTPRLPSCSFPAPAVNLHVCPMPAPDRCDWFVDEREDGDYSDDEGYH